MTASTYLGILLIGGLYVSFGCFASALTRNQIVAAIVSFALGFSLFMFSFFTQTLTLRHPWLAEASTSVSIRVHMDEFVRGVVDSRYVVFYDSRADAALRSTRASAAYRAQRRVPDNN